MLLLLLWCRRRQYRRRRRRRHAHLKRGLRERKGRCDGRRRGGEGRQSVVAPRWMLLLLLLRGRGKVSMKMRIGKRTLGGRRRRSGLLMLLRRRLRWWRGAVSDGRLGVGASRRHRLLILAESFDGSGEHLRGREFPRLSAFGRVILLLRRRLFLGAVVVDVAVVDDADEEGASRHLVQLEKRREN